MDEACKKCEAKECIGSINPAIERVARKKAKAHGLKIIRTERPVFIYTIMEQKPSTFYPANLQGANVACDRNLLEMLDKLIEGRRREDEARKKKEALQRERGIRP